MRTCVVGLVSSLAVLGLLGADDPRGVVVEVAAGPWRRVETPVIIPWPEGLDLASTLTCEDMEAQKPTDVQVVDVARPRVAFIVRELAAGATRRYRFAPAERRRDDAKVTCVDDGKGLTFLVGGHVALTYNYATIDPPAGLDPVYRRSGFVHPLSTPSGRVVTADFPPDHAHQHGLFFAWVNTVFNGHKVDFWNQASRTGRVRGLAVLGTESGPLLGQVKARLWHEDITGAVPMPVLGETWTLRVYSVTGTYLVDFESVQTCAGARPLEINKYLYGGLGLRGTSAWFDPKAEGENPPDPSRNGQSDFLTSEGKTRANGNHSRPRWVDLSGRLDGQFAGVTVLDHPGNFRFPQPVRLHPNKPYLSLAPEVEGSFRIEPGHPYVSRYRLVLHDGPTDPRFLDALWHDYAEPPTVRVVKGE
jgi:hypothetical protein